MISCHDGKHRNNFSTVGKHLNTHCSRRAKSCRKYLQYQSIHQREKPSNNGKEGELLRPLLVAFWRIKNTQFPAVQVERRGLHYLYSTFICSPASPRRTLDGGPIHAAPMRPSASVSLSSCQTSLGRLAGAHVTLSDWRGGTSDRPGMYVPLLVCRRLSCSSTGGSLLTS